MSVVKIAALSLTVLFLLVAVVRLFHRPLRLALRVVFNSALVFWRCGYWSAPHR